MAKLIVNPDRSLCEIQVSDEESIGPVDYDINGTTIIRDEEDKATYLAVGEEYDELDLQPGLYTLTLISAGVTEGEIEDDDEDVEVEESDEDEEAEAEWGTTE